MAKLKITDLGRCMVEVVAKHRRRRKETMPRLVSTSVADERGVVSQAPCCSLCFQVIEQTWDHNEDCVAFIDEPVTKFLKEGLK